MNYKMPNDPYMLLSFVNMMLRSSDVRSRIHGDDGARCGAGIMDADLKKCY